MSLRKYAAPYGITIAATALYYAFAAPGVLAALSLAIPVTPTASVEFVAVAWVLAETIAVGLPFVALALVAWSWPSLLPRRIWLAPLAVVVVPVALSALWNLWALGTLRSGFAIGEALVPELSIAIDILAALLGSALVIVAQSSAREPARFGPKAARRTSLGVTRR